MWPFSYNSMTPGSQSFCHRRSCENLFEELKLSVYAELFDLFLEKPPDSTINNKKKYSVPCSLSPTVFLIHWAFPWPHWEHCMPVGRLGSGTLVFLCGVGVKSPKKTHKKKNRKRSQSSFGYSPYNISILLKLSRKIFIHLRDHPELKIHCRYFNNRQE